MQEKTRYPLLDVLRGLCMISMVCYHLMYDLRAMTTLLPAGYSMQFDFIWQQSICWGFILLSGACRNLSKNGLRHGLLLSLCGLAITLITYFLVPEQYIFFGVLSFAGAACLLFVPLRPLLEKMPAALGALFSFALFLFCYGLPQGYVGLQKWGLVLPKTFYHRALAPLGLPDVAFWSSDYFPVLPWFLLFLTGYFAFHALERQPTVQAVLKKQIVPLGALGRQALPVYLLHQPILYGAVLLLGLLQV